MPRGLISDIDKRLAGADFGCCEGCKLWDICSVKKLYCVPAIMGIMLGEKWDPEYSEEEK